jgi:Ca2+-binding RTX toxin-like protein
MAILGTSNGDSLFGTDNDDTIRSLGGDDTVLGGKGDDRIEGGSGNDKLSGEEDNDTIFGGIGNDRVSGGDGDDRVNGDSGADTLNGGRGNDSLFGGSGQDNFVVNIHEGDETILDFTQGSDKVTLAGFKDVADFEQLDLSQDGPDAILTLSENQGVRFVDVQFEDLTAADFNFQTVTNIFRLLEDVAA